MTRQYQIEGMFVNETLEREYQLEFLFMNETVAADAAALRIFFYTIF